MIHRPGMVLNLAEIAGEIFQILFEMLTGLHGDLQEHYFTGLVLIMVIY